MNRTDAGRDKMPPMEQQRDDAPPPARGSTVTGQGETQSPKAQTPNERDESSQDQAADNPSARRMGELAHESLQRGERDTTKGNELDATYHRTREDAERGRRK